MGSAEPGGDRGPLYAVANGLNARLVCRYQLLDCSWRSSTIPTGERFRQFALPPRGRPGRLRQPPGRPSAFWENGMRHFGLSAAASSSPLQDSIYMAGFDFRFRRCRGRLGPAEGHHSRHPPHLALHRNRHVQDTSLDTGKNSIDNNRDMTRSHSFVLDIILKNDISKVAQTPSKSLSVLITSRHARRSNQRQTTLEDIWRVE